MQALRDLLAHVDACLDRGDWVAAAHSLTAYDVELRGAVAAGRVREAADWQALIALHASLQLKLTSLRADTLAQIETVQRERAGAQRCLSAYGA